MVVIGWFLAHRYDGVRLWNLQGGRGDSAGLDRNRHQLSVPLSATQPSGDPSRPEAAGASLCHRDHPHLTPPAGCRADPLVLHPRPLAWHQLHAGDLRRPDRASPVCGLAWDRASGTVWRRLRRPQGDHLVIPFVAVWMDANSCPGANSSDRPNWASPSPSVCSGGLTPSFPERRNWCATPHSRDCWAELPTLISTC